MLSQRMYLSHLLLFSARKNRRQLQTQTLKDTRQDAACPPYKVERAGIVPQRVCDVWTAWENPSQEIHRKKEIKITRTVYVRNTEGI